MRGKVNSCMLRRVEFKPEGLKEDERKRLLVVTASILGLTLLVATGAVSQDWPMFHHDLTLAGWTPSGVPATNATLWIYDTAAPVEASPAVVGGMVYIGNLAGMFYCLDGDDGGVIWSFEATGAIHSSAAVADGRVYFLASDGMFWCLDAMTGVAIWVAYIGGGSWDWSSPAVHAGNVFIAASWGGVYSFDAATGAINWVTPVGGAPNSMISVMNGKVYTGTHNFDNSSPTLVALDEVTGAIVWTFDYFMYFPGITGMVNCNGAAVLDHDADGDLEVFFGVHNWFGVGPQAICLDEATGLLMWATSIGGNSTSTPAVHNGWLFIGSDDHNLYALNATTGAVYGWFPTGGGVWSSPAVGDGIVVFGSLDHTIYAISEATGSLIWSYYTGTSRLLGSPAIADNRVYVGNENGKVYAFATKMYVDIKPTSCPNPFNTKAQGKLPVAILGTMDLDVYDIDPNMVALEGVSALRYSYEDVATPYMGELCGCHEEGPDGLMDLVLHFDRQAIYATMGAVTDGEYRELRLEAKHINGGWLEGSDCVWIKHKVKEPPPPPRIFTRTFDGSSSQISLCLGEATDVSLMIYDVQGRRVKALVNETMPAGDHTIRWDGMDDAGNAVADGVYFANVRAGTVHETAKMILMK